MIKVDNIIIGAGIAGLAAGQRLKECGEKYHILEKGNSYGGLCDNFKIGKFYFDRFVHLSFTKNEKVRSFFDQTEYITHIPDPENYYHGRWIKHPAQNNLFPLSEEEKKKVLNDLETRRQYENKYKDNYEYWLRYQFGDYFAEHFPMIYTKKYWGVEARELETEWVGNRIYQPTTKEIIEGMKTSETPVTYYAKEMRYPKKGGFKSFLSSFANEENISYNQEVIKIDAERKIIYTKNKEYQYKNIYSSIPLPEYKTLFKGIENAVAEAIDRLCWTSSYIISLGMKGELMKKNLWDYIYDETILPARIYSPSEKSSENCPTGCCSLQAEIYYKNNKVPKKGKRVIMDEVIDQLHRAGIIKKDNIIEKDIRFEKYGNVIFDAKVYKNRKLIIEYLKNNGIMPIGRFGEWDYLWTDQSFLSGYRGIEEVL